MSGLLVAALVLASCGPAVTEEEEEEVVTEEEEEEEVAEEEEEEGPEMVRDALGKLVEKPKYGGVFIQVGGDPLYFDSGFGHQYGAFPLYYTNEKLIVGDWAKGPAGTDETTFTAGYLFPAPHIITGLLLEDWEIIDGQTVIMHVRQGVRWHDKPPVNGREFDADDVVYSMKYLWNTPRSFYRGVIPWDTYIESLTATDKWTVVLEAKPGKLAMVYEYGFGQMMLPPREVIEEYGDMMDWKNVIGTGPFELVDYVTGSSLTYERNPNYWRKDPLLPDNQLPYVDGITHLVIPDASTQMAALRTGKVDLLAVGWENAADVQRTNPELEYSRYLTTYCTAIFFRVDKPELPFYDIRVRRALSMAVNQQEMADTYYGGEAELITSPLANLREWADVGVLTPFEELPESTRELFEYHPDKAKELLTEAGYPNGFAATIPAYAGLADLLSIVKAYWADVGVDLTIDVKEFGAFAAIGNNLTHKELYVWPGVGGAYPFTFYWWTPESSFNYSQVYDPVIKETIDWFDGNYFNYEEKYPRYKEFVLYLLDQAYELQLPGQYAYMFWQPWLKNYHGEREVAYGSAMDVGIYIWIDQDLKEEMTGRR
jgi:peptide/nickel transport system substrate-binding protein